MVINLKYIKGKYTVFYIGNLPTNREILNFCIRKIEEIENSSDYKLLVKNHKKIKRKYFRLKRELQLLKSVRNRISLIEYGVKFK